jgi:Phytanoyl-CoA dioxygenase (PhyH)
MSDTSPHIDIAVPDVLTDAELLAREGRGLEAIQLLTEANRACHNPRVEERLVTLRHEAFASVPRRPIEALPMEVAPEKADSPLAPTDLRDLTVATLRQGLARHGCVLVRHLISPERAEELARGVDRALDAFAACQAAGSEAASPWYLPFVPDAERARRRGTWVRPSGSLSTADSPRMLFELMELVDGTGIGALVEAFLGERPAVSAKKCTLRRVPADTHTNWHQDGAFLGRHIRSLNLWLALSPCGVDAPGLDIVPQRIDRILTTGTDGALFDWSVSHNVVLEAAGGPDAVLHPEFSPGDALLFDHLFVHRTGVTPGMTRERWAIETWFFAPSTYPDGQVPLAY